VVGSGPEFVGFRLSPNQNSPLVQADRHVANVDVWSSPVTLVELPINLPDGPADLGYSERIEDVDTSQVNGARGLSRLLSI
jgi:hypothetical protein